ncbi:glycosyltransferase family 4 protein [Alteromonas sp. a30]|uniref:glycosyltransferase family 4 protein n=1 Tax=Alteromonas sp. a30 TaxID=2730917 RepID=UPI00227FC313|nr:glycosyltransferase family 4 protein [Alteromonas sp. a30]MCY7294370.1 glycosyltransferase family 4 protein [Alteromonas sp. a30]
MKILYFHQHFSTPDGGTGTRSYEFSKALVSRGHEVTVICGSYDVGRTGLSHAFVKNRREGLVEGIKVIEYQAPYSNRLGLLKRAAQFLKFSLVCCKEVFKQKPELVFCTSTPLTIAIPGIFAKLFARKKFVFEVRDLWPELPVAMGVIKNPLVIFALKLLEVVSYKLADHVIALSAGMAAGVSKHVEANKVSIISNGCDLHYVEQASQSIDLPDYLSPSDKVFIYSGTLGIANGLMALNDAAEVLKKRKVENIKILLAGDGMLRESLEADAKARGLHNIFFLGNLPKKQVFSIYTRCTGGLMILDNIPAFYNGTSPNKFFDYLSAGLPIICNYPGWIEKQLDETGAGIAVNPDDAEALADALIKVAMDEERTAEMAEKAKELAVSKFNREDLICQFTQKIEEVGGR